MFCYLKVKDIHLTKLFFFNSFQFKTSSALQSLTGTDVMAKMEERLFEGGLESKPTL